MTEHSKISPSGTEDAKGRTLIERAEDTFSLEGFRAAPVPRDLAPPVNRRVARRTDAAEAPAPAPVASQAVPAPAPATDSLAGPAAHAPEAENLSSPPAAIERIPFRAPFQNIDRDALRKAGLIIPDGRNSALLEEFRIVKRHLLAAMREGKGSNAQRVLVCSPLPDEGKTFCATNLALAIAAERDTEVVLVDADFAKPSVLGSLGLQGGKGLMDALADAEIAVEDCVIPTDVDGLFVLPAGRRTATDSEYLASGNTRGILDRLSQGAPNRMVIFDSPPALAASPAADLARHAGQAVVVVRADRTGQSALEDALTLLSACPDIKLLLNSANFSPSGRRFGDYYGYGE